MRLLENKEFLNKLSTSTPSKRNTLITKATEEEIKTIVECIINLDRLYFQDQEKKCLKRYGETLKALQKSKWTSLSKAKNTFVKHQVGLSKILACFLTQQLEEAIDLVLHQEDGSSHESNFPRTL